MNELFLSNFERYKSRQAENKRVSKDFQALSVEISGYFGKDRISVGEVIGLIKQCKWNVGRVRTAFDVARKSEVENQVGLFKKLALNI